MTDNAIYMIFHKKLVLGLLLSNRTWATDSTSLTCDAIKFLFHSFSKIRVIYDKNSSHLRKRCTFLPKFNFMCKSKIARR